MLVIFIKGVYLHTHPVILSSFNVSTTTHKLDGVYTNATLIAVKDMTATTLHYLRQAFFTVYASTRPGIHTSHTR